MHESLPDPRAVLATLGPEAAERRVRVRFRCTQPRLTRTFIANAYRTLSARLVDISTEGVGLLVAEPVAVGTRLTIELEDSAPHLELLVEVKNVTAQPDGSWRCGCSLVWRISEEEMWLLLKNSN